MTDQSALELKPDGTVAIDMGDTVVTLRRPTLGEFKRWRIQLSEMGVELTKKREAAGENPSNVDEDAEERAIVWWTEVFKTLSNEPVPEPDDWPPFLIYGENVLGQVLTHWRTVPLAPGPRSNKSSK